MKLTAEIYKDGNLLRIDETILARDVSRDLINARARAIILERYPDWKQANMTARGVELQNIRSSREWTVEETSDADALQAAWDWIKAVRNRSNELQAADENGDDVNHNDGSIDGAGNWPG